MQQGSPVQDTGLKTGTYQILPIYILNLIILKFYNTMLGCTDAHHLFLLSRSAFERAPRAAMVRHPVMGRIDRMGGMGGMGLMGGMLLTCEAPPFCIFSAGPRGSFNAADRHAIPLELAESVDTVYTVDSNSDLQFLLTLLITPILW